ncbi:MAG: hypothetical protein EXR99_12525 [Gemmataceae bacterium]|nr:hypothetical protein [Gemmataceae bacterium]
MRRFLLSLYFLATCAGASQGQITAEVQKDKVRFLDGKNLVMELVLKDPEITRPYFTSLHSPNGLQLTRNHPPKPGADPVDHADMHPGLWLAFGNLSGFDYWRNKARVLNTRFDLDEFPEKGSLGFKLTNHYLKGLKPGASVLCEETSSFQLSKKGDTYVLDWTARFRSTTEEITFGDQEEMGLGVRVNTLLSVKKGGRIQNQEGGVNEKGTWGKQSGRCEYSGKLEGKTAGLSIEPQAGNFRISWFHSRDYGLMVANPFGRKAFTKREESSHRVPKGEVFQLGFRVELFDK